MLIRTPERSAASSAEITPPQHYYGRREFLRTAAGVALLSAFPLARGEDALPPARPGPFGTSEPLTPHADVTRYNNYFEFASNKSAPARLAQALPTRPWTVSIEGEVARPGVVDIDDILHAHALEERVYRLRCVEAWSMVIPWIGFPLADFLKRLEPTSRAKYVEFTSVYAPEIMPNQRRTRFRWPYTEGLRIDEAMHPLTLLAVGLYGETLPKQNGAPLRLVVPWKYGFKSAKAIVKIRLTERQPITFWNRTAPDEYGFYANVNPEVDHPRWSQARERRFGEGRRRTLMFNGYGEQVASLYSGMDLRLNF